MLLTPTEQAAGEQVIRELRVIEGTADRRYTLPATCIGAGIRNGYIWAASGDYIYRAATNAQRFQGYSIPLPEGRTVTAYYGITTDGKMLLASGENMYALTLPQ